MKFEDRDRVVNEFRRGETKILISTDVLARGFDVSQVRWHVSCVQGCLVAMGCADLADCTVSGRWTVPKPDRREGESWARWSAASRSSRNQPKTVCGSLAKHLATVVLV